MKHDAIAVIDFGGQYAHLIATKVRREAKVLAEILQPDDPTLKFAQYKGIIISGSPSLASHGEDSDYNKAIYDLPIPILGFCFGHQEIAKHYGGKVIHGGREWGHTDFQVRRVDHPLFKGCQAVEQVWMSHFDSVVEVGPQFEEFGTSSRAGDALHGFAALGSDSLKRYGFQFHPEVDDTVNGGRMIANFVLDICQATPSWTMERYIDEQIEKIRAQVGDNSVFLLASGGVDSTVAARLIGEALGPNRLHLLHVDNGMMRKGESRRVLDMFADLGLGENLHFVDATFDFLEALKGETEPERKRRIIGDTFIEVFQKQAARLGIETHLLGQGTIYPDTIETGGTCRADTIKTHHNRVPVIDKMIEEGKVIEPLADLYKVEVRELGEKLGIPHDAIWRHPFPGPGLGVRCLCSRGEAEGGETAAASAKAEAIASKSGLSAMVLPIRSVGVKADLRSYEHPVMIAGNKPFDELLEVASAILRDVDGVNRCIWTVSERLPRSARLVAATMTKDRLDLLREADALVMDGLRRHGIYGDIWQCPTVLVPMELDGKGHELVIVRPIHSERAMTAKAASLPLSLVQELEQSILGLSRVCGLCLDLTSKPPGTIEWE
ncbi:MAG: glutamine-hydrolyzing GMP synthase [Myxococcota bacterium]|nr:glutamine-hydrolyzing GMP synthase [Myxococcota bacterium]